jgi:hypothetical protein
MRNAHIFLTICILTAYSHARMSGQIGLVSAPVLGNAGVVHGEPYSMAHTVTTTKTLADGTKVTNERADREMRDSDGRTRIETKHKINGKEIPLFMNVSDPAAHTMMQIRQDQKDVIITHFPEQKPRSPAEEVQRAERRAKAEAERDARMTPEERLARDGEPLGQRNIAGVLAEGRRFVRTIPIGQRGNDRELRIVTESWTSPDLKVVLEYSVDDPIEGRTESKVTELARAEPDPALFKVPEGYKVIDTHPERMEPSH